MPMHKRESLIYTVLMCFTMVLWMSMYNVALHMGTLNMEVIRESDIFNDDSAEVIEVEEEPKDE